MKATPYNKVSEETKRQVIEFYYKNKDIEMPDIAKHFGISFRAVPRILTESGINTRLKNRYTLDESFFESIETECQAYWLGFLYADGFVGDEHYNNIVLTSKDKEVVESFAKSIDFTGNIRQVNGSGYDSSAIHYTINFSSTKMANDLRSLGLYPGKSTTMKGIPVLKEELYRHFIRGYFDGDGSIVTSNSCSYHNVAGKRKKYSYDRPCISMIGTRPFLEEIEKKMPGNYKYTYVESRTKGMFYLVTHSIKNAKDVFHFFYDDATYYLKRKYEKFLTVERH